MKLIKSKEHSAEMSGMVEGDKQIPGNVDVYGIIKESIGRGSYESECI